MKNFTIPRSARKYIYSLAIAFVPVAVYYGWLELEASVIILPLILAVLNLTPTEIEEGALVITPDADVDLLDEDPELDFLEDDILGDEDPYDR